MKEIITSIISRISNFREAMADARYQRDQENMRYNGATKITTSNNGVDEVIEYETGEMAWYRNGKIHRDGDLPAVIHENGKRCWYRDGKLHRDGGLPAKICPDGRTEWYQDGRVKKVATTDGSVLHYDGGNMTVEFTRWETSDGRVFHRGVGSDKDLTIVDYVPIGVRQYLWENGDGLGKSRSRYERLSNYEPGDLKSEYSRVQSVIPGVTHDISSAVRISQEPQMNITDDHFELRAKVRGHLLRNRLPAVDI